jgi:hypothetical protein
MAKPILVQDDFSLGMKRDVPREHLPKGAAWDLLDYIPNLGAPLRKRGATIGATAALSNPRYYAACGFAEFAAGSRVVGIDDAGALKYATPASGTSNVPPHAPTFYRDRLYITDAAGTASLKYFDGTTVGAVSGSPPTATSSCVYKDHLVVARTSANLNRVWFSSGGDPTSWDTAADGQWLDSTYPVQGLAAMRNMILVFSEGHVARIRGDIIPGVAGSDFVHEPLFNIGTADPASIAVSDEYVIFANPSGVYMTDGLGIVDLTKQGGIKTYWQTQLLSYASTYTIACGIHRGIAHVCVMNGSTHIVTLACDIDRRVWWRYQNVNAIMMAATPTGLLDAPTELYFARRDSNSSSCAITRATGMYEPSSTSYADTYGAQHTPSVETAFYRTTPGQKRVKAVYVTYDGEYGAGTQSLTLAYVTDPAETSYTSLSPTLLQTDSGFTRARRRMPKRTDGFALKLSTTAEFHNLRVHSFEVDMQLLEAGRVG